MASVDLLIVREYFEANGFFVRQLKRQNAQKRRANSKHPDEESELLVVNSQPLKNENPLAFMLFTNDLPYISRAMLSIKGWHNLNFTPAVLKSSTEIFNFLQMDVLKRAEELFPIESEDGSSLEPFKKILILPGLPVQEPHRSQSIELLRKHGVDGILSFRAMLQDIINRIDVSQNYESSEMSQTLRILKSYDMLRSPQLELFAKKK